MLSVVSPVYEAEAIVPELVHRIGEVMQRLGGPYEIILVDDGSSDGSWPAIEAACRTDRHVKGIRLSRNFGQHYAITAGVNAATGDRVVLMDCDLQDDPEHIAVLMRKMDEGYDIVFTKRLNRGHALHKTINTRIFNWLFRLVSDRQYDIDMGSLVAFSGKVRRAFSSMKEHDRLYVQMLKWLGFRSTFVEVEHRPRHSGRSSYTLGRMMTMAVQGWTSHSDKLLRTSVYLGLTLAAIAFLGTVAIVVLYFIQDFQAGWPSVIVTILFSTGLILTSLGIAGIYIGKTFQQVKDRPLYIVDTRLNFDGDEGRESNP